MLKRLKYDNDTIDRVKKLVKYHDERPKLKLPSVRRFIVDVELSNMENLMRLKYADLYAHAKYRWDEKVYQVEKLDSLYRRIVDDGDCLSIKDMAVNGNDLMKEGIAQGPEMGKALNHLFGLVLDDPSMNDKDRLIGALSGPADEEH